MVGGAADPAARDVVVVRQRLTLGRTSAVAPTDAGERRLAPERPFGTVGAFRDDPCDAALEPERRAPDRLDEAAEVA